MTPRSFVRTPSVTNDDVAGTPVSENGSGDESLPPHTSEIGTLKKLPNHGTAWLGSSSGVYFVNTVRRAFSAALVEASSSLPASEDILTGEDADGRNYNGPVAEPGHSVTEADFRKVVLASLGRPPSDRQLAMELVTSFFRCWHPLFPFMHGPRFLQDIDTIYAMPDWNATTSFTPAESRRIATFQLIINIASLDRRDLHLPVESRIKSTSDVTRVAGCFSVNHDIQAIQLLIAAELYLVATISLRQASTVAGMILKLIYHAGLHRCPLRYASLSHEDCEIRKRIFWSAYALDRHLSLSLGDPNTVQDNDIDVCLSGRELHKAVAHELIINPADEIHMHMPRPQAGPHGTGSPADDPRVVDLNDGPQAREKVQREAAMTAYVHYGKLTGRIIEIFHKSIHARFQTPEAITFLSSDIETWWNDLPASFTDDDEVDHLSSRPASKSATPNNHKTEQASGGAASPPFGQSTASSANSSPLHKQLSPFFLILYHQLQLLLNRPRLSLDQSTAEFQHGLQVCIKASRNTLTALRKHRDNKQSMLLPGLLSATWMAGLIIAFACQLGKYPKLRAVSDIGQCLGVLESMGWSHWFTVKNCHKVLSLLLENIKSRRAAKNGFLNTVHNQQRAEAAMTTAAARGTRKRTIDDAAGGDVGVDAMTSPKRKSVSESSPSNAADFRRPTHPVSHSSTSHSRTATSGLPNRRQNMRRRAESAGSVSNTQNDQATQSDWQASVTSNPSSTTHARSHSLISETSPYTDPNQAYLSPTLNQASTPPSNAARHPNQSSMSDGITGQTTTMDSAHTNPSGSALYADPQDLNFAQSSNHNLDAAVLGTTLNLDDPMFWGNFDYNISDIFGAASWENILGGGEMMGGGNGMYPNHWGDLSGNGSGNGGW